VRPGSFTHLTEFFGPMLAVMRFEKLSEAVARVNQTGYGLTSGLESLDEREWDYWKEHIRAGNLYINRVTTGAVVLRQPFGGFGKSGFGPGLKAGGPNYVAQFMDFTDVEPFPGARVCDPQQQRDGGAVESLSPCDEGAGREPERGVVVKKAPPLPDPLLHSAEEREKSRRSSGPSVGGATSGLEIPTLARLCEGLRARASDEADRIVTAVLSYERQHREEFGQEHDHFKLVGQDNVRRYRPVGSVRVRIHAADTTFDIFARTSAAHVAGCRVVVSTPPGLNSPSVKLLEALTETWAGAIEFIEETDAELAQAIRERQTDRVRYAAPDRAPLEVLRAGNEAGGCVISRPVSGEGRLELLWYLREQSLSIDYHRYGNLGLRAGEPRADVL